MTKFRCKQCSFGENYRYLFWKYTISDCDWYTIIKCLMGKLKSKQQLLYPITHDLLFYMIYVICVTMISAQCLPKHN